MKKKKKSISYGKWGQIFILPFFIIYFIFSLIPLADTVRYSFYEYYRSGIKEVGPNFVGMANYISLLKSDMLAYGKNTLILWLIGFIPQIVIALVLASWFTDARLKIHHKQFFKVVIYLPNLIMASAFALLFFTLFSTSGPVNSILMSLGWINSPIDFMGSVFGTRSLIGLMNFLMWFGNTTIMLMAAIMGISVEVFEACEIDPETEVLVTAEAKSIPLIYEMAKVMKMPRYVIARKSVKGYMRNPIITTVNSITNMGKEQILVVDEHDAEFIKGKKVAIIDDVISTGSSIEAIEKLVKESGGEVIARAAVLAEGDAADRTDIIYLEKIPLFFHNKK